MADAELVKQELDRVYDLYGAQLRSFRRTLYVLIVSGLAVFAIIVVPFLTFRDQVAGLQAREDRLAVERQAAGQRLEALQADLETLQGAERDFAAFAERHRNWDHYQTLIEKARERAGTLAALRRSFSNSENPEMRAWAAGERPSPPESVIASDRQLFVMGQRPCAWKSGVEDVACGVCQSFLKTDARMNTRLRRLSEGARAVTEDGNAGLTPIADRACGWLDRGEIHWKRQQPLNTRQINGLRALLTEDLRAYSNALRALTQEIRPLLPLARTESERLDRSLAATGARLVELESQLSRIASFDRLGTPIGDLPIGLGQIVLLFPVIMALAYVVLASSFARLVALRRAFAGLCRKRDAEGDVMDRHHVAVIAPLWLERDESLSVRLAKGVILALPLLLILANLVLVQQTQALAEQLPADAAITPTAYLVLYGLSVLLALGGLFHILRSIRVATPAT